MQITIPQTTLSNYNGSSATLKILSDQDFVTSDGVNVARNYTRDGVFYDTVSCTVNAGTVTIPSYTLDSTTDSSKPNGTYTAILYDGNKRIQAFYSGWRIPTVFGSTPTWEQLSTYNGAPRPPIDFGHPTTEQVQTLIDAAIGNGVQITSLNATYGNSLSSAITSIGSTKTTLLVERDTTLSTSVTVPSNVQLKFENGAKFTKSGSGTITFSGVGVLGDPRHQIFSGFTNSDITWDNERPALRPEWFGGRGDDSTDNTSAINLCLGIITRGTSSQRNKGGIIRFDSGKYRCTGTIGGTMPNTSGLVMNVIFEGQSTKATPYGHDGGTQIKYTGTGTRFVDFRSALGIEFKNLSVVYSNSSFTGILCDFSMQSGQGGALHRFKDCYFGCNVEPGGYNMISAEMLFYFDGAFDIQFENCKLMGAKVGIRWNDWDSGNDGNINMVKSCEFSQFSRAGMMNPYQNLTVIACNVEGTSILATTPPNGGMPYFINHDYAATGGQVLGLNVMGCWFGDVTSSGGAWIRLPDCAGVNVTGNFFGPRYSGYERFFGAATGTVGTNSLAVAGFAYSSAYLGFKVWLRTIGQTTTITGGSGSTITLADNLTSSVSSATVDIGDGKRINAACVEIASGTITFSNNAVGGAHGVNVTASTRKRVVTASVTNGSAVVTSTDEDFDFTILNQTVSIVSSGISVPGGTTVISIDSPSQITLSNPVTVTSGSNPRTIEFTQLPSATRNAITSFGNTMLYIDSTIEQTADPNLNTPFREIYDAGTYDVITSFGNKRSGQYGSDVYDYSRTTSNWGFSSADFGRGKGVIAIGNASDVPSTNPASGVLLYGSSDKIRTRDKDGAIGYLAPVLSVTTALDFGSISAGGTAEKTVTVTGASYSNADMAYASPNQTIESGLTWCAYVSGTDTVTVRMHNTTASPIDPANRTWRVIVPKV